MLCSSSTGCGRPTVESLEKPPLLDVPYEPVDVDPLFSALLFCCPFALRDRLEGELGAGVGGPTGDLHYSHVKRDICWVILITAQAYAAYLLWQKGPLSEHKPSDLA